MKLLEEKILREGKILPGDILKVGSFLNQQIDTKLLAEMADEVKKLYADTSEQQRGRSDLLRTRNLLHTSQHI